MMDDLRRSGITETQSKKLGLRLLTPAKTVQLTGQPRADVPSYVIPYYTIANKKTDYWRLRYLEAPRGAFGARLEDRRYTQPKDTPPHLYFSPTVKWVNPIAKNTNESVIITEGEKKAAAACLAGFPTIGLGGVWSWKSKQFNMDMLPEFDDMLWDKRSVYLAFDSDMNEKPQVAGALHALANKLLDRGAVVKLVQLPDGPNGEKVGLDDFLVPFKAKDKQSAMAALLSTAEEFSASAELYRLNDEIAVIGAQVYHFSQAKLFASAAPLREIAYATRKVLSVNAAGTPVRKPAIDVWLEWPKRREHSGLTYAPGSPPVTRSGSVNVWPGWGAEPIPGSVTPFLNLLEYLCSEDQEFYTWFLKWLSYPLQHPGTKLKQSVVLWSPLQGVGKTFVGVLMGDIYGSNYVNLTQEQLHDKFNDWAARKQFILGDEITGSDRRRDADRLKQLITQEQISINAKYQAAYTLPDCINYLFTTNHPAAFFLEDADRRFAIHQIDAKPKPQRFYQEINRWRTKGGIEALFDYLLQVDLKGFDPDAPALRTKSKGEMIVLSRTELEDWLMLLLESPASILEMDGHASDKELWTATDLARFFDPDARKNISPVTVGRALAKAGLHQRTVKVKEKVFKLWPIVNTEHWVRAESTAWAKHVEKYVNQRKF